MNIGGYSLVWLANCQDQVKEEVCVYDRWN